MIIGYIHDFALSESVPYWNCVTETNDFHTVYWQSITEWRANIQFCSITGTVIVTIS